ncbi:hypothetical protein ACLHDF_07910 [Priestia aryabhattai]|uniref:hypothetical protein n=1 Tax=Priestia megaterium TaxID=1404 RepID=UPI0039B94AAE
MARIFIAYASTSGTTEEIEHINVQSLVQYDGILLSVYTWGNGDLPYEVEDF